VNSQTDYNTAKTLLDQTIVDATPVLLSPFEVLGYGTLGLQIAWYGDLAGTWSKLGLSNSYVLDPTTALFTQLTDSSDSLVAFLAAGGKPSGTPGSAFIEWSTAAGAVQLEFTRSSGSGRLWVVGSGKR
jgi:hypothetical protein